MIKAHSSLIFVKINRQKLEFTNSTGFSLTVAITITIRSNNTARQEEVEEEE